MFRNVMLARVITLIISRLYLIGFLDKGGFCNVHGPHMFHDLQYIAMRFLFTETFHHGMLAQNTIKVYHRS